MLINALNKQNEAAAGRNKKTGFIDDQDISNWARGFVAAVAEDGLINGYPDKSFQPRGSTTRAEACTILANFLNFIKPVP